MEHKTVEDISNSEVNTFFYKLKQTRSTFALNSYFPIVFNFTTQDPCLRCAQKPLRVPYIFLLFAHSLFLLRFCLDSDYFIQISKFTRQTETEKRDDCRIKSHIINLTYEDEIANWGNKYKILINLFTLIAF